MSRGEVWDALGAVLVLLCALFLGQAFVTWAVQNGPVSREDLAPPVTPYATCRELPEAHQWAPRDSVVVHLVCPEVPS